MHPTQLPQPIEAADLIGPDGEIDLQRLLTAWSAATERLQRTHETLQLEVRRLTEELEVKNRELARKNRLADLGQMASHIAHEVRNSMMPITLYLSLLRRRVSDDSGSLDILDKIEPGFTALDATVNDLLHFTADRDPHWQTFDIGQLAREVYESLQPQFAGQGVGMVFELTPGLQMTADRNMIRRVLLNLLLNALDALPEGGEVDISSTRMPGGAIEIEVADSGPGLPEAAGERLFDPFFTTKSDGTGLGLAIVYRIAEVHGGRVTAANCPQGGAAFTLRIPQRSMEAAA